MKASFVFKTLICFIAISQSSESDTPALVSVLQISETDQKDDICILKYKLAEKFQDLPTPRWLQKWDNLMFHSFCDNKYDIKVLEDSLRDDVAKLLLFSLASGISIKSWDREVLETRFGKNALNILKTLKERFWMTGKLPRELSVTAISHVEEKYESNNNLGKRLIVELDDPKWEYDTKYPAKVFLLRELQEDLESRGDVSLDLLAPAFCKSQDHNFACLLWAGNAKRIRAKVAAQTIKSGIGGRSQNDSVSCKAKEALKEVTLNSVCLSHRSYGCT